MSAEPTESSVMQRRLRRLIGRLTSSDKPIVWLRAGPGSGKSRLLQALRQRSSKFGRHIWLIADSPTVAVARDALALPAGARPRIVLASRDDAAVAEFLLRSQLYGDVDVITARELYLYESECRTRAERALFAATGGWPLLVDAWQSGRESEMQTLLPQFLAQDMLPSLPESVVVALYAALLAPLQHQSIEALGLLEPQHHPLLQRSFAHMDIASSWVRAALLTLRRRRRAVPAVIVERLTVLFSATQDPVTAIAALLEYGQTDQALELFRRSGGMFFGYRHSYQSLERVLRALGPEHEQRSEEVFFARLWLMIKSGQPREALLRLESRHPGLPVDLRRMRLSHRPYALLLRIDIGLELDEPPPAEIVASWGRLQALLPATDDMAQGLLFNSMAIGFLQIDALLEAEQLAKESLAAYRRAGSPYLVHCMLLHLCDVAIRQSRTLEAVDALRQAEDELRHSGHTFNSEPAIVACFKSRVAYEEGRFEDCPEDSEPILQALRDGDSWPDLIVSMAAHFVMTAYWSQGLRKALDRLDQFVLTLSRRHGPTQHLRLKLARIRILQVARRHSEAAARLEEYHLEPEDRRTAHLSLETCLIRLRHLVSQERIPKEAARLASWAAHQPHLEARQRITLALLQAHLKHRSGDHAVSRRHLRIALRDAEARALIGVLIEDGEYLERLLPAFIAAPGPGNTALASFAQRVLKRLHSLPSAPHHSKATAGVTRQEHRVLTYLVDGYTNKQIARALALSDSTVKFHLRNLFKKLHVASRSALVVAVQKRGIAA